VGGREGGREGGVSFSTGRERNEGREGGKEGGGGVPVSEAMLAPGSCMMVTVQDVLISCVPLFV
jgi:hypothetical protein